MNCRVCRGACCESFERPAQAVTLMTPDIVEWVKLHDASGRCTALTPTGRCGIYDDRPLVCRLFVPGGIECLETVRTRRTPGEYCLIREPHDPERIHR